VKSLTVILSFAAKGDALSEGRENSPPPRLSVFFFVLNKGHFYPMKKVRQSLNASLSKKKFFLF